MLFLFQKLHLLFDTLADLIPETLRCKGFHERPETQHADDEFGLVECVVEDCELIDAAIYLHGTLFEMRER